MGLLFAFHCIQHFPWIFSFYLIHFLSLSLFRLHRLLIILVLAMLFQTVIITIAVYYCFKDFMVPVSHVWYICAALSLSTGSLFATTTLFNVCCIFIIRRIHCINLILNQLIFDEPISGEFVFLNSNHRILSREFPYNDKFQRETATKWFLLKRLPLKWLRGGGGGADATGKTNLSKQTRPNRVFAMNYDTIKNAWSKMWPVKKKFTIKTDDISEMHYHHLDNLMRTFNLSDVKIILTQM